jgi:endonuclease YncB( thermonuclease family)
MRIWGVVWFLLMAGSCWAAEAVVTDGNTIIVKGATYRLDGIAAPQPEQVCLDDKGSRWACGIEARDKLRDFIGKRDVQCKGSKTDLIYRNRFIGVCGIEGEEQSLNRWLVREGWAFNFGPIAVRRFKQDQDEARDKQKGLWKGCFALPQALLSRDKTDIQFMGASCPKEINQELQKLLFPDHPVMPEGCSIKGKLAARAHFTGHRGIYYPEGCRSYLRIQTPDRWFCSEQEAQAEGYRAAFICRPRKN